MKRFPPLALVLLMAPFWTATPALAQRGAAPARPTDAEPPAARTEAAIDAWRLKNVADDGSLYAFYDEDGVVLFKADRGQDPARSPFRVWVRSEHFEPMKDSRGTHRSDLALYAFDCPLGRYRLLTMDLYPQLNLQGDSDSNDAQDPEWTYPRPGAGADRLTWYACRLAANRAAQNAAGARR